MPSIFGYENLQRPRAVPRPEDVGQMLMQRQAQGQGMMPGMGQQEMGGQVPGQGPAMTTVPGEPVPTPEAEPQDPAQMAAGSDWPSSSEAALRAAILRAPGMRPSDRAPGPNNREQMLRLGIPEQEVDLLIASGGANG